MQQQDSFIPVAILNEALQRNIKDLTKYNRLLDEFNQLQLKYIKAVTSQTSLLNGLCDYIEELQESRKWWWLSFNQKITNRLLSILVTRDHE